MASATDYGLIGMPLIAAIFAGLLVNSTLSLFAAIGSLAAGVAAVAILTTVGGFTILGSGITINDYTIKLTFVTTFLTAFYTSNILIGLNMIATLPVISGVPLGLLLFGIFTTMYVFGMFGIASSGGSSN